MAFDPDGPGREVVVEFGSEAVVPLACDQEKFVVVVAAAVAVVVVVLVVVPVAELAAALRLLPSWGLEAAERVGRAMVLVTRAEALVGVKVHRDSDAAWVGSRRPTLRHPTAYPAGLVPRHLCRGRTVLSYLKTNKINFTTAGNYSRK